MYLPTKSPLAQTPTSNGRGHRRRRRHHHNIVLSSGGGSAVADTDLAVLYRTIIAIAALLTDVVVDVEMNSCGWHAKQQIS